VSALVVLTQWYIRILKYVVLLHDERDFRVAFHAGLELIDRLLMMLPYRDASFSPICILKCHESAFMDASEREKHAFSDRGASSKSMNFEEYFHVQNLIYIK